MYMVAKTVNIPAHTSTTKMHTTHKVGHTPDKVENVAYIETKRGNVHAYIANTEAYKAQAEVKMVHIEAYRGTTLTYRPNIRGCTRDGEACVANIEPVVTWCSYVFNAYTSTCTIYAFVYIFLCPCAISSLIPLCVSPCLIGMSLCT